MEDEYLNKLKHLQKEWIIAPKIVRVCLICKSSLNEDCIKSRKYCSRKCERKANYLRNIQKIKEYQSKYRIKNYERDFPKKKKWLKKWYAKNKKKHKENVIENYRKNIKIWDERGFTYSQRNKLLKFINKLCPICKKKVKVIHHKMYGNRPKLVGLSKKGKERLLKEYSKNLLGFCSKICHRNYERKIRLGLVTTTK